MLFNLRYLTYCKICDEWIVPQLSIRINYNNNNNIIIKSLFQEGNILSNTAYLQYGLHKLILNNKMNTINCQFKSKQII